MNIAPIGTDLGCTLRCRNWSDSQLRHFIEGMEYFLVAIGITEFSLKKNPLLISLLLQMKLERLPLVQLRNN